MYTFAILKSRLIYTAADNIIYTYMQTSINLFACYAQSTIFLLGSCYSNASSLKMADNHYEFKSAIKHAAIKEAFDRWNVIVTRK